MIWEQPKEDEPADEMVGSDLSDGFQTLAKGFLNFSGLLIKPVSVDKCKIFGSKYF